MVSISGRRLRELASQCAPELDRAAQIVERHEKQAADEEAIVQEEDEPVNGEVELGAEESREKPLAVDEEEWSVAEGASGC